MMFRLIVVLALTVTYALMLSSFAWQNLLMGAALSTLLVTVYGKRVLPSDSPQMEFMVHLLVRTPLFVWMLAGDILTGTWQVTMYVTGLRTLDHPGIVKVPFGNHSDSAVGLVGHLITLSPGSFVVDIDWTDRTMLVHYIDASEPDKLREAVEKYYRLWEYGRHKPQGRATPETSSLK